MKRFFKWLPLLLLAAVCAGVVSCGDDDDDNIINNGPSKNEYSLQDVVGVWKLVRATGSEEGMSFDYREADLSWESKRRITIGADGSYVEEDQKGNNVNWRQRHRGTVRVSGNKVYCTYYSVNDGFRSQKSVIIIIKKVTATQLVLLETDASEEYEATLTFQRESESTPTAVSIVGTWRYYFISNDPERGRVYDEVTFRSNHTGELIEEVGYGSDRPNYFTWTQNGKNISIVFDDGSYHVTWTIVEIIDNNTVVISNGRNNYTAYRQGDPNVPNIPGDPGEEGDDDGGSGYSGDDDTQSIGTVSDPLGVSEVRAIVASMSRDQVSSEDYYVRGKISSIQYPFSAGFGTAIFNITDTVPTGVEFMVYSTYYKGSGRQWRDGDTQIAVGDKVTICGKVVNYHGTTPEFAERQSYVVSINGR